MPSPLLARGAIAAWFWRAALCLVLTLMGGSARAQVPPAPPYGTGALTIPKATPPPRIVARELRLQNDLRALAAQARYSGWLSGAVITMGCAAIAVGAVYPRDAGALLFPLGALALSRGVLGLSLMRGRERQAVEYLSLPTYTPDQVRARIAFGEAVLAYQARRARIGRLVDGSVSLLTTASYVPLLWWLQRRDNPGYHFNDDGFGYAVLTLSVINAGAALFTMFSESGVEQRYRAYREQVDRQEREQPGELQNWRAALQVRPVATRSTLGLHGAFQF